jgi:hypothetical protein
MTIDRSFVARNTTARERLRALAARLSAAELGHSLGGRWTVAAALAHLAFWDRRAVLVLERWAAGQPPPPLGPAWHDADLLNDSLLAEWLALPPPVAVRLALEAAEAADATAAGAADALVAAIVARGEGWRLERFRHRQEHLDEIERLLRVA